LKLSPPPTSLQAIKIDIKLSPTFDRNNPKLLFTGRDLPTLDSLFARPQFQNLKELTLRLKILASEVRQMKDEERSDVKECVSLVKDEFPALRAAQNLKFHVLVEFI
jgi:hypothetical protein